MNKAGGSAAFGEWAKKHVKTRAGALLATFLLGVLIFVDDYFNCLTVGSVMMPVTDGHKISRAKLAYIIDATAAPICMIAPISSWAAAVSGMVDEGVYSGIELFVRAIPYNYYSLLTIVFVVGMALMGFDYGPMAKHERNAREKGDLFTEGERVTNADNAPKGSERGKVYDLLIPVIVLIICCVVGMIYVGGFFEGVGFIDAFSATDASVGLPWGSLIALLFAIVYYMCRRLVSFKEAMNCLTQGFIAMVPAMLILTFAVTLKTMTGLLGADVYVAGLMQGASTGLTNMLPAIIFLVACFLAFASGTSWGTFGILIPIVTGVFTDPATGAIVPLFSHLRYHDHGFGRGTVQSYQPCIHPGTLRTDCGSNLVRELYHCRICTECGDLSGDRYFADTGDTACTEACLRTEDCYAAVTQNGNHISTEMCLNVSVGKETYRSYEIRLSGRRFRPVRSSVRERSG